MTRALVAAMIAAILHVHPAAAAPVLKGRASWYAYRQGEAAAGPALRAALGPSWRGRVVTVRAGGRSVRVKLTDFCACYRGSKAERLIDLDVRAFAALAPTSAGLVRVEVTR